MTAREFRFTPDQYSRTGDGRVHAPDAARLPAAADVSDLRTNWGDIHRDACGLVPKSPNALPALRPLCSRGRALGGCFPAKS